MARLGAHLTAATLLRISAEGLATALVLTVQVRTGRAATAGFVQAALLLPYVVSGPVIGHVLDRVARPHRFAVALAVGYTAGAAVLLTIVGVSPLVVALAVGVLVGCAEPVVVALTSMLPRFVPADRLPHAYGLEASSYNTAAIVGPGLAAGVAALVGGQYAGTVVVGSAVLGALALLTLRLPGPAERPARVGFGTVVGGGIAVLVTNRVLRALTAGTTLAWLGFGGIAVTSVLLAQHLGGSAAAGGQLIAAMALGSLVGALTSSRWLRPAHAERVMVLGLAGFGLALAALALVSNLALATVVFFLAGLVEGPLFTTTLVLRQRESPPDRLGQVNTTGGSLKIGASAVGAGLTGLAADALGAVPMILVIAALPLSGAVVSAALLRKNRSTHLATCS